MTTFIGRQEEKLRLTDLLRRQEVRLVTLTGPGGIGKTRLAIETARDIADAFRDGARFLTIEAIADPELVKLALAQEVGASTDATVERSLFAELADRHMLLIIDNVEQVVSIAPFFARLLQATPDVKLLITSRIPLRISAEHVFETPPLSLPATAQHAESDPAQLSEAVRLFLARSLAANPHLVFDNETLAAIAGICERLDGFPLAIELAAARANILTPQAMLSRLDRRLPLLTSGARDQPERLQSLRAAIGWSYDLLDPEAQALFRILSIFTGGFSLESVEAVALPHPELVSDILDTLSSLIDGSLVQQVAHESSRDRYAMYETIREFGLTMLEQRGELHQMQDRHAAYFAAMAERGGVLTMRIEYDLLDRLDDEQANMREALGGLLGRQQWDQALDLAANLAWYWFQRGQFLEGQRWLEKTLSQAAGQVDPGNRCLALIGLGLLLQASGHLAASRGAFEEAIRLSLHTGEQAKLAIATSLLAGVLATQGESERAVALFEENRDRWDQERKPIWMGHANFHLGLIALAQNDAREAVRRFGQSVLGYDQGNVGLYAVDPLQYLGLVSLNLGDLEEAHRAFSEALDRLEQRKSNPDLAMGIASVAAIAERTRKPGEAIVLFTAAAEARKREGAPYPEPARSFYDASRGRAISKLDPAALNDAECQGRLLTIDQALAAARAILDGSNVELAPAAPSPADRMGLTERELDVLRLLAEGQTNDEIAQTLFISNGTARTHVSNILGKLGAHTRTEAAGIARRQGLV